MFDQTSVFQEHTTVPEGTPIRYTENGTVLGYCYDEIVITNGQMLHSNSLMLDQTSCIPNTGNAGNYYSWPAATAGGNKSSGNEPNSICPKGWQLTTNTASDPKSYNNLIVNTYNISTSGFKDEYIRYLPMSFIRSSYYYLGSLSDRGSNGRYWSAVANNSTLAYHLYFNSGNLGPQSNGDKYAGFAVRCVSR